MGILNVTPDSFSDGGDHATHDAAVAHGLQMAAQGAAVIDVGGESTRPGSQRVDAAEQIRRTQSVIRALRSQLDASTKRADVAISIDTTLAPVAAAALDAGADFINDISGGRDDPAILRLAAQRGCAFVVMHMQGTPATMQAAPSYADVVAETLDFLMQRAAAAEAAGIARSQIVIDPGIGFGKTREHNLQLLASLDRFVATGFPVLLGCSRKRFMGSLLVDEAGSAPPPRDLVGATCATTALGVAAGVMLFRVHDVWLNRQAAEVAWAIESSRVAPRRGREP
jgi:dihydropteroate synthase